MGRRHFYLSENGRFCYFLGGIFSEKPKLRIMIKKIILIAAIFFASTAFGRAAQAVVAVAANFAEPARQIAKVFKKETGYDVSLSFGATGNFYNQIIQGAPFDVFLAADTERPQKAVTEGYGVAGTNFTYAIGTLVLWSARPDLIKGPDILENSAINHIAYCNPQIAPYGQAALQAMQNIGLYKTLKPKLVEGQSIAQAFQFVKTGNAEIGFVALSQVIHEKNGSYWYVPQDYYHPIRQDAVLLKKGENNEAAKAFLIFLKSPHAHEIIRQYGYMLSPS